MDFDALHASTEATEEMSEEFVFGRLNGPDVEIYERHLVACETCRRAVEDALDFIKVLRRAAEPDS